MVRSTSSKAPRSTRRSIGNVGSPPCAATRPLWDSGLRLSPPSKLEPAAVKYQPEETSPNPGRGEFRADRGRRFSTALAGRPGGRGVPWEPLQVQQGSLALLMTPAARV